MKSSFDILSAAYKVIQPVMAPKINGGVYLGHEPQDKDENVIINVLTSPGGRVQKPILNVNVACEGLSEHQADLKRMKTLVLLLYPLLDDKTHTVDGETYHFEIADDKGTFKDMDNPGKFFYNLRVNCITV